MKLTPLSFTKNSVVELSNLQMHKINAGDNTGSDNCTLSDTGQTYTVSGPKATVSRGCSQYCVTK